MAVVMVVLGIVALLGGSELVVRGATKVAHRLGIPSIVIGLTVVSIGTSTPELAVGIRSALQGVGELAVGTVAGTNVVNLLLILGLSALIRPLALRSQTVRMDLPIMAVAAVVVVLMALDGELSGLDGVLLLGIAVVYTGVIFRASRRARSQQQSSDSEGGTRDDAAHSAGKKAASTDKGNEGQGSGNSASRGSRGGLPLQVVSLIAGIAVIVLGADWLVGGSVDLARQLGVSDALIGLTIVAIGTSAPEIATTLVSTFRGDRDVAIGNLIGSSVYNIALILGATAVVAAPEGVQLGNELITIDLPLMAAVALLCVPVFITGRRVSRVEGALFVAAYLAYLALLLVTRL